MNHITRRQALQNGLVDRLGNINDAIRSAAKAAKISSYKLVAYPEQKTFFHHLGSGISEQMKTHYMKSELGDNFKYYQQIKGVTQMMRSPQARLPYDIVIN